MVQNKRAVKAQKKAIPPKMDQRSFELIHFEDFRPSRNEVENVMSSIIQALYKEGTGDIRIGRLPCTDTGRTLGTTTPTSTLQDLLKYRDMVLKTARLANDTIRDAVPQQRWKWIRIHSISPVNGEGKRWWIKEAPGETRGGKYWGAYPSRDQVVGRGRGPGPTPGKQGRLILGVSRSPR